MKNVLLFLGLFFLSSAGYTNDDVLSLENWHWECMQYEPVMVPNPDYDASIPVYKREPEFLPISYFFTIQKDKSVRMEVLWAGYYSKERTFSCLLEDSQAPLVRCKDESGEVFVSFLLNDRALDESLLYEGNQLEQAIEMTCSHDVKPW